MGDLQPVLNKSASREGSLNAGTIYLPDKEVRPKERIIFRTFSEIHELIQSTRQWKTFKEKRLMW